MQEIARWICLIVAALLIAFLLMWVVWSKATDPVEPATVDLEVRPVPAPVPMPEVTPSFNYFSRSLYDDNRRLRWGIVLTLGELADAAYDDAEGQVARAEALGAKVVKPLAVRSSEGFVASDDQTVVIAFRGTQGLKDIITDVLGFPTYMRGGKVHHGFQRAIGAIYNDAIKAALTQGAANKAVYVTGHSLGGAIACGFSMRSSQDGHLKPAGVVTFGQPLVMSQSLCEYMLDNFGDEYVRIVNGVDPITTLVNIYRHAGARARLRDEGEYDWRPPIIAVSAPPPGSPVSPNRAVVANEDIEELQLISKEEAMELVHPPA